MYRPLSTHHCLYLCKEYHITTWFWQRIKIRLTNNSQEQRWLFIGNHHWSCWHKYSYINKIKFILTRAHKSCGVAACLRLVNFRTTLQIPPPLATHLDLPLNSEPVQIPQGSNRVLFETQCIKLFLILFNLSVIREIPWFYTTELRVY